MTTKNLKIHSENILPIIKKWLYSERDIFVRELISNATDALSKLKILNHQENLTLKEDDFCIHLKIDKEKKALIFSDNGIGMTEEEVEKYIAQIAFSGAEEFANKYQKKDEMIGHFGLGFYSSYMVATKVEIQTLSYQKEAKPVFWSCDGSSSYTIEEGQKKERGTEITLYLDIENEELLDENKLKTILENFCSFLPFPIHLEDKKINTQVPLWLKNPTECTDKEYLDFFHKLYPFEADPLFWVHLNVDYPFNLKGILYFPKTTKQFDFSKSKIHLYCNRVFVSDNCKDLLPDYLTILKGALDSPDIPLNVSRSYLQMDRKVKQLGTHVAKKVADRLKTLYRNDKETFTKNWKDLEPIIKYGILQDEKFYEKVKEVLVWQDTDNNFFTLDEYKALHGEKTQNKLYYTQDAKLSSSLWEVFHKKGFPVLVLHPYFDTPLMSFIEEKEKVSFQRVDSAIEEMLDASKEKTLLQKDGRSQSQHIADFVKSALNEKEHLEVEAKSLASSSLPALFIVDEKERRMKDYFIMTQGDKSLPFPSKKTFVVNTNHKLIQEAMRLKEKDHELSKKIIQQVHDLSLLSQKELEADQIAKVVQGNLGLLEELASQKL